MNLKEYAEAYWNLNKIELGIRKAASNPAAQLQIIDLYFQIGEEQARAEGRSSFVYDANTMILAHQIIMGQKNRIAEYGKKAFPLTDKQIEAIGRALRNAGKWRGKAEGEK